MTMNNNNTPTGKSEISLTIEMVNDKVAKFQLGDSAGYLTLSGSERLMSTLPPKGGYAEIAGYLAPTPVKNGRYMNTAIVLLDVQVLDAAASEAHQPGVFPQRAGGAGRRNQGRHCLGHGGAFREG